MRSARTVARACLAGVLSVALVVTGGPFSQSAKATPRPVDLPLDARPVDSFGLAPLQGGLVRPNWVSASVTARATGKRVEVLAERTMTSRTWALPNGTAETEEAAGPVQYPDPSATATDGWRRLDVTLSTNADGTVSPFKSMPGHSEGAGKYIKFYWYTLGNSMKLDVQAWGPDIIRCDRNSYCAASNRALAKSLWYTFAQNVKRFAW